MEKQIVIMLSQRLSRERIYRRYRPFGYIDFISELVIENKAIVSFKENVVDPTIFASDPSNAILNVEIAQQKYFPYENDVEETKKLELKKQVCIYINDKSQSNENFGRKVFEIFKEFREYGYIDFFKMDFNDKEGFYTGLCYFAFKELSDAENFMAKTKQKFETFSQMIEITVYKPADQARKLTSYLDYTTYNTHKYEEIYRELNEKTNNSLRDI